MICLLTCVPGAAGATVVDKYQVTDEEKAACRDDAVKFCSASGQDEDKLLGCMKANKISLSAYCRIVLDAGLRRRGLQ